jgi:hypothetical protein
MAASRSGRHARQLRATAWLGLTPEPERHLPRLLALLDQDETSYGARLCRQERRVSRLVLRGNARRWRRYLDRAADLALAVATGERHEDPELALVVVEVVLEHDRMLIGLPGRDYDRTAGRRTALEAARRHLAASVKGPGVLA